MTKSFEQLLFEGALTAVRSLSLEELYHHLDLLAEWPAELTEFPRCVLETVLAEKHRLRAMN